MVRRRTLGIFYSTLFICGAVNSSQNGNALPLLLAEPWHSASSTNQNVTLIDSDDHVAVYYNTIFEDNTVENNTLYEAHHQWPFSELSTAWKYVKDTYGSIGSDPHLFLILHRDQWPHQADQGCLSQSFLNPNGSHRPLIDCHFSTIQFENGSVVETVRIFENIFSQIGDIIQYGAKGRYNDADQNICGTSMSDILFYDIYRFLKSSSSPADVDNWREVMKKPGARGNDRRTCFNFWLIPIYEKYNETSVLNRYFELTKQHWRTGRDGKYEAMNLGDFIHFWSAAAGEDLQQMADKAFEWTEDRRHELSRARNKYRLESLYDYTVNDVTPISTEWITRFWRDQFIAVIVCLCVAFLFVIMVLIVFIGKNNSKLTRLENRIRELTARDVDAFRVGSIKMNHNVTSDLAILCMPFNTAFEVPAERIVFDESRVLGQGEFGIVYLGILKGETGRPDVKVAVKKNKLGTQVSHFKAFLSEIKIMAYLEKHENIAALLATVTLTISKCEVIAAMEFCEKGDLLDNLQRCRRSFRNLWNQHYSKWANSDYVEFSTMTTQPSPSGLILATEPQNVLEITTLDLISWAAQIANGMLYLSSKNIIHGDLAARNVLLTADNIPKISDFGLSRQLLKYSNYRKTSTTPIPWKWLAIEALTHQTFSIQSDVWSFGVTLWEIFTLGQEPYPGRVWDTSFVDDLIAEDSLIGEPGLGNSDIHDLMMNCMHVDPKERFAFARIKTELENIRASL